MIFLKIAWRNLIRNRRRSLITISAISFGMAAVVFLWSFVDGFQEQMVHSITSMITGDIQIYPQDAEGLYNMNKYLEEPEEVRTLLKSMPEVDLIVERVIAGGIVSSTTNSVTTFVVGGNPRMEEALSQRSIVVAGRSLKEGDEHETMIGRPMAKALQVGLGDKVVVLMQDRFGQLVGESFRVVGIFESGSDQIDNTTTDILLPVAQRILALDNRVTKFLIRVHKGADRDQVLKQLSAHLDPQKYRISPWEEIVPMLSQLVAFQQRMIVIVIFIVLVVLAVGVLNTLMMSFVERIREFGLMKALGTTDQSIGADLLLETLFLTFFGIVVGLTIGLSFAAYFRSTGINLAQFGKTLSNFLIGTTVYPHPRLKHILTAMSVVLGTNMLAALYPVWRASRLEPIEAMRHVG